MDGVDRLESRVWGSFGIRVRGFVLHSSDGQLTGPHIFQRCGCSVVSELQVGHNIDRTL